ncbi:hypothetical protein [Halalkalicoccus salilacus]|uniref:hypothetical protein n=1 Tax=Halalkalicoccus sp. GCM10025704 TaxID=3252662 RepID=UPI00361118CC
MAELDPQAEALLETVDAMGLPPTYGLSVESARARLEELFAGGEERRSTALRNSPSAGRASRSRPDCTRPRGGDTR